SGYRGLGFGGRFWRLLQRSMVGYGGRPVRAGGGLLMMLILGSLWFGRSADGGVTAPDRAVRGGRCLGNSDDEGLEWNAVPYMAGVDVWVSSGMIAMGWILATTVAAGAGRALRRTG